MEPQRFLTVEQHSPKVILSSIIKKPFLASSLRQSNSKHIFIRVDTELRQLDGMEMLRTSLMDQTQKDTYFEYIDCLNYKQMALKRELVTIFIIPPRILFALKEKLRYHSKNACVVILCKDEFDVEHQLSNLYLQKITKLITCDPLEILCYIKQQIQNCYASVLNASSDPGDSKFHFLKYRNNPVNIYYPSKFQQFTKVFQTGAVKRRINYPHLHFYCYNNKKDITLKDKAKVKTRRFMTKDKIGTENYISNFQSRGSISTINDIETNIVVTTRENQQHMLEYIQDRQGYQIVALSNQEQKTKFLKEFQELFSGVAHQIQIISSQKLTIFLPHSDQQLITFVQEISTQSVQIIQYSSLSVLSTQTYRIGLEQEEFGLILTHCDHEPMMEMMLTMKDIKNIKLIVYPYIKSHAAKSDSSYIFKRCPQKQGLFEIMKQLIDERRQYFSPIQTIKHRRVVLLIDKRYTQLCQEIIIIVDNSQHVGLKIYQKEQNLFDLVGNTSSQINYILICKEQRRVIISQYTRQYQNIKYIVLSELIDVEYNPNILQIFTRHTDLLEFISRLCREKEQSDRTPKLTYQPDEKAEGRQQFDLEDLIIVPVKQVENKPCICIYSPNRDYCPNWLVLEQRLKVLDKRIDIFHYNRVIDITKINFNQQPLSLILVTNPNIHWASNYSNQFQTGINIIAYSKTPLPKNAMIDQSVNLVTNKLEEIQFFIADAIKHYDSRKASIISEHDNYEATKLSLQSEMKLTVERKTRRVSPRTQMQYYPMDTSNTDELPPKVPRNRRKSKSKSKEEFKEESHKIQGKSESDMSQKSEILKTPPEKKIKSQLTPKSQSKPDPTSGVSLSELCMDSRLSTKYRVSQLQQFHNEKRVSTKEQNSRVYILQHKSIEDPVITSEYVTTMIYSGFEELRELYKELLIDSSCKIIVKLIVESEYEYIPNHPQSTIIKYNPPKKKQNRFSSTTAHFHKNSMSSNSKRISILDNSTQDLGHKRQQRNTSSNKLRIHSLSKQKKFIQDNNNQSENNIISKKNFFAQMFQKQFVYFLVFEEEQHIKKIINTNKSSNPRIRIKEYSKLNTVIEEFQSYSKQNTYIMISSDKEVLIVFFKQIKLKQFKSIYVGEDKLPPEIESYRNHVSINNVAMLNKFIGCIPRFYQSDKVSKDLLQDHEVVHIYFQDYLHTSLLLGFLTVCHNNQKIIPHKLQIQELQSTKFQETELVIIIINNKFSSNYEVIKGLSKNENIVVYYYQKEGDQINRLLELMNNGRKVEKMNIKPKNIQKEILALEFSRTVRPQTDSEESNSSNSLNQTYKEQLGQNKKKNPKQNYTEYFQEIDQTAYMFQNRTILQKVCGGIKSNKLNVIIPDKEYEDSVDILSHLKNIEFMTYNTTKILTDSLKHQDKSVVLLNQIAVKSFPDLQQSFNHHIFITYDSYKSQNSSNLYKTKNLIRFCALLQLSLKYKEKKSKVKPGKSKIQKMNIFYKYPKDYTLKQTLQKLSTKIKCVAYESVKALLSQLPLLDLKNSYNIIIQRDDDIFQLEENVDLNDFKMIRLMSPQFQDDNSLDVNENILIEATKYSTVSECIKKTVKTMFKGSDDQATVKKKQREPSGK